MSVPGIAAVSAVSTSSSFSQTLHSEKLREKDVHTFHCWGLNQRHYSARHKKNPPPYFLLYFQLCAKLFQVVWGGGTYCLSISVCLASFCSRLHNFQFSILRAFLNILRSRHLHSLGPISFACREILIIIWLCPSYGWCPVGERVRAAQCVSRRRFVLPCQLPGGPRPSPHPCQDHGHHHHPVLHHHPWNPPDPDHESPTRILILQDYCNNNWRILILLAWNTIPKENALF